MGKSRGSTIRVSRSVVVLVFILTCTVFYLYASFENKNGKLVSRNDSSSWGSSVDSTGSSSGIGSASGSVSSDSENGRTKAKKVSFDGNSNIDNDIRFSQTIIPVTRKDNFFVELQIVFSPNDTGKIVLEVVPEWAPLGCARFKELIETNFFTEARFFRVIKNFMAQFGLAANPGDNDEWRRKGFIKVLVVPILFHLLLRH